MRIQTAVLALLLPTCALAQSDVVQLTNGETIEDCRVQDFTIRELTYRKGGNVQKVSTDQVANVELGKFAEVYRRGMADGGDPDLLLTTAREQLKAKKPLLAQLGFAKAAELFYLFGKGAMGSSTLEEMVKEMPDAGTVPAYYRLKFESYIGRGDDSGYRNAMIVAKKLQRDATTNAWPMGFAAEGDFFIALIERAQGGDAKSFQDKMRQIAARVLGSNPQLASRANVQLAHSMREGGDEEGARRIYESVLSKDSTDENSRAGAYLGLGLIAMNEGTTADREPFRKALLYFLRVRLETANAWENLQSEALYNAMVAAQKWQGADYRRIIGRCRLVLLNDFGHTEWANRARSM